MVEVRPPDLDKVQPNFTTKMFCVLGLSALAGAGLADFVFSPSAEVERASALNPKLKWDERIPSPRVWVHLPVEVKDQLSKVDVAINHPDPLICRIVYEECTEEQKLEIRRAWTETREIMPYTKGLLRFD